MIESQKRLQPPSRTEIQQELARRSLLGFTQYTFPDYKTNWHHVVLCKALGEWIDGSITRLMCFMPPRRGKSEIVSRRLPAYLFGVDPDAPIISASYGADLARRMNRDTQRIIDSNKYKELFPEITLSSSNIRSLTYGNYLRNADEFEIVDHEGYYKCAGVGGGLTGRGFKYGIIDDPVKDREQADSEVYREKVWDWYMNVFYTRKTPDARIALVMTRWHEDDLAGRLIQHAENGSDHWHIVVFQELFNELNPWKEYADSEHITLIGMDQDPRSEGQALWPGHFTQEESEKTEKTLVPRVFTALYQQSPNPPGGGTFKIEWLKEYTWEDGNIRISNSKKALSRANMYTFSTIDLAASERDESCPAVISTYSGSRQYGLFHIDQWRETVGIPEIMEEMDRIRDIWGVKVFVVEANGMQLGVIQTMMKAWVNAEGDIRPGFAIIPVVADRDKVARAMSAVPWIFQGWYWIPANADWVSDFVHEYGTFPNSKYKDQVDAFVYAVLHFFMEYRAPAVDIPDGDLQDDEEDSIESVPEAYRMRAPA